MGSSKLVWLVLSLVVLLTSLDALTLQQNAQASSFIPPPPGTGFLLPQPQDPLVADVQQQLVQGELDELSEMIQGGLPVIQGALTGQYLSQLGPQIQELETLSLLGGADSGTFGGSDVQFIDPDIAFQSQMQEFITPGSGNQLTIEQQQILSSMPMPEGSNPSNYRGLLQQILPPDYLSDLQALSQEMTTYHNTYCTTLDQFLSAECALGEPRRQELLQIPQQVPCTLDAYLANACSLGDFLGRTM